VSDEQIAKPELFLKIAEEVHDLRLNGNVESANRLVCHDEGRGDGQCARDADALALSAGELVRVAAHVLGPQPNPVEQRRDTLLLLPIWCTRSASDSAACTVMRGFNELYGS
jgi:hypothetical protein